MRSIKSKVPYLARDAFICFQASSIHNGSRNMTRKNSLRLKPRAHLHPSLDAGCISEMLHFAPLPALPTQPTVRILYHDGREYRARSPSKFTLPSLSSPTNVVRTLCVVGREGRAGNAKRRCNKCATSFLRTVPCTAGFEWACEKKVEGRLVIHFCIVGCSFDVATPYESPSM